jgi:MFS family permease
MGTIVAASRTDAPTEEFRHGWPVVLACFFTATFAWGFGFFGQSVYVAVLHDTRGWPLSQITGATTLYYLAGAALLMYVHRAIEVLGPQLLLVSGAVILGVATVGFTRSQAPWQLYVWSVFMAVGWAFTTVTAIATTLSYWFERRRGFALQLALNGASASGFTIAPLLTRVVDHLGLANGVLLLVAACLILVVPMILLGVRRKPSFIVASTGSAHQAGTEGDGRPAFSNEFEALRSLHFWSIAVPFSLALTAQVGFIINQTALLLPHLGIDGAGIAIALTAVAAFAGRSALAPVIDRLNQRHASSVTFVWQAAGLAVMLAMPDSAVALYIGSIIVGLSVGNIVSLPALVIQHEFAARSFGLLVGLNTTVGTLIMAAGPGLFGLAHDLSESYAASLCLCIGLQLASSLIILWAPRVVREPLGAAGTPGSNRAGRVRVS